MRDPADRSLRCPSAQPGMAEPQVLGVAGGKPGAPRIAYLNEYLAATPEVLAQANPVPPTEIFRLAAKCEETRCTHFDGHDCKLASRIVALLHPVVDALPACIIRKTCRWYAQEGGAACLRCPQIVTSAQGGDEQLRLVAAVPATE